MFLCLSNALNFVYFQFEIWFLNSSFSMFFKSHCSRNKEDFKGRISYTLLLREQFMTSHSSTQHLHEIFLQSEGCIEPWPHKHFLILFCKMGLLRAKYIALSLFKVKISVSVTEMKLLNLCDQCLHTTF